MKTYFTTTMYLLLLFSFGSSLAQTSIYNKDHEVTNDVVKIQEFHFNENNVLHSIPNLRYLDTHEFESGYITSKIRIIDDKVQDFQRYQYNASKNEFSFEEHNATYGDIKEQYQLITFNQLKFYYPKTDFVVIQNKPNILYEFSYSIQGRKITRKLEKQTNNLITDTYDDYGNHIDTYNAIGQKINTETISLTKSDLLYSVDGLLEQSTTSYGKNIDKLHNVYYSYEKDEKGNWIKRVKITVSPENEVKSTYTSRILTYANGEVTGDGNYHSLFVMWEVIIYSPDLKEDSNKNTSATKITIPNGLVWKKNNENTQYWLYNNGSKISGEGAAFWADNDFYVYLTLKNEVYLLKDFKTLAANTYHDAVLLPFKPTNGVWYKKSENQFIAFNAKGKQIKEVEISKYAQNGIDIIVKEKDQEKTVLLKNFKNVGLNKIFPLEILSSKNMSDEISDTTQTASTKIGCISGDCQNGQGQFIYEDGASYIGQFKNSLRDGSGDMAYKNYDIYIGKWKNDKRHGKGSYTVISAGFSYSGDFINDQMEGEGTSTWNTGEKYTGTFKANYRDGKGVFSYADGTEYVGEITKNKKNGQGIQSFSNGDIYEGSFINDERTGHGVYTWANNTKYKGEWKNGKRNGKGTYYDYNVNKKYERIYEDDKLLQTLSTTDINTQQIVSSNTLPNNGLYWKKNSENTEVWLYENGTVLEGTVFFVDNTLYFYDVTNDNIYSMQNFKSQTANLYHNASKLPHKYPHGAWMRWDAQGGLQAVNAKGVIIRGNTIFKNAANNIDVIYKGKGETETLFFKGFHNAKIKEVFPAEIYNSVPANTTTTASNVTASGSSNASSFQAEINKCKNSENSKSCLLKGFNEKYTSIQPSNPNDSGYKEMAMYLREVGEQFNAEVQFRIILDSKIPQDKLKLILEFLTKEERASIKAKAQKVVDDYQKTHN